MRTPGYELRTFLISMAAFGVILMGVLAMVPGSADLGGWAQARPQLDAGALAGLSPAVQAHLLTALIALVAGPVQFVLPKGTRAHRVIGWIWVGAMFVTAVASLFIRDLNAGGFSPIHIFSLMAFVSLPLGVWLARRGDVASHRQCMIGLYIGLVIAGVLAAAPGRVLWDLLLG